MCKKKKKKSSTMKLNKKTKTHRLSGTFLAFKLKLQKTCLTVFLSYQSFLANSYSSFLFISKDVNGM